MPAMTEPSTPHPAAPGPDANPEAGWFGYREVAPEEKTKLVRGVFGNVADKYDLMNDLMSGGIHRLWKARFIDQIRPRAGERLLDVAGGTGDISFRFLEAGNRDSEAVARRGAARSVICDLSEEMVRVGRDRGIDRGLTGHLSHVVGNAEALPVADRSVDVYTIAFGLRNVTRIDTALAEARRVLRPGGRFFCLEFSRVVVPVLDRLYDRYSFAVIPRLGEWVVKDRDSYQYLVESIRQFPSQEDLAERMQSAGLERVQVTNLTGGIAAIHSGRRI